MGVHGISGQQISLLLEDRLTIGELRENCRDFGVSARGSKIELCKRLVADDAYAAARLLGIKPRRRKLSRRPGRTSSASRELVVSGDNDEHCGDKGNLVWEKANSVAAPLAVRFAADIEDLIRQGVKFERASDTAYGAGAGGVGIGILGGDLVLGALAAAAGALVGKGIQLWKAQRVCDVRTKWESVLQGLTLHERHAFVEQFSRRYPNLCVALSSQHPKLLA